MSTHLPKTLSLKISGPKQILSKTMQTDVLSGRYLAVLMALLIISAIAETAHAQRCRVSMGTTREGTQSYMTVYEYDYVSTKPAFPGGDVKFMEYINRERIYPAEAYKRGIQGRVTCSFVINADGAVSHVTVLRSVEESLNREAIRILSEMPPWTPGEIDGCRVPVRVIRSVPFRK